MFKLKGAEIGGQRGKLCKGLFKVKLRRVHGKVSKNKRAKTNGDDYSIVEFTVLEAKNQEAIVHSHLNQKINFQPCDVGAKRSWSMNMKNEASAGNLLAFLVALAGFDPTKNDWKEAWDHEADKPVDWDEFYELVAGEDQPFCQGDDGAELWVETDGKITEDGFAFVVHDFTPTEGAACLFPPLTDEEKKGKAA